MIAPMLFFVFLGLSNGFQFSNQRVSSRFTLPSLKVATTEIVEETPTEKASFIHDELRTYAMKFHTKDQSPKEGQQPAQTPFTAWTPTRLNYVQFLVDSLKVYETLEAIVEESPTLASLKSTGLERSAALKEDLLWMKAFDPTIEIPECGPWGLKYSTFLTKLSAENLPKFICHYYNYYFAHTAGGRMIGKRFAKDLLEGNTLQFYQWDSDVKVLLEACTDKLDAMALNWSSEEKQQCLDQTVSCFQYGSAIMTYINPVKANGGCPVAH
jgi:heme oxygenase